MDLNCECPANEVVTIPSDQCKITRKPKIARIYFQKVESGNNFIGGTNPIEASSSWTGLTGSVNPDKVAVSPYISDPVIAEADVIEGSENFDGAPTVSAVRAQPVTITWEDPTPDQVKAMDSLFCNDDGTLGVFLIYADNSIHANKISDTPLTHGAIPISIETLIGMPPSREGALGSKYLYKMQFALPTDWYRNSDVIKAEDGFSFITDVVGV